MEFILNGKIVSAEAAEDTSLLELLRTELGVRPVKDGCAPQGQCGCCTVLVDGEARVACVTPAARVSGRSVTTLDGLDADVRTRLADALVSTGGSQCGVRTPGNGRGRINGSARGAGARQGVPGASRFYVSFEDDLMRNFGASDRMTKIMERFGLEDGQELEHPWLDKSVENAQKRVEARNFDTRKHVLEYDDVMNQQRELIYAQRKQVHQGEDMHSAVLEMRKKLIDEAVKRSNPDETDHQDGDRQDAGIGQKVGQRKRVQVADHHGGADWSAAVTVRHSDHDFNRHVNNAHYVEWALECLPDDWRASRRVCELDISYRASAMWGDTVISEAVRESGEVLLHRIRRASDHAVLATARTVWS